MPFGAASVTRRPVIRSCRSVVRFGAAADHPRGRSRRSPPPATGTNRLRRNAESGADEALATASAKSVGRHAKPLPPQRRPRLRPEDRRTRPLRGWEVAEAGAVGIVSAGVACEGEQGEARAATASWLVPPRDDNHGTTTSTATVSVLPPKSTTVSSACSGVPDGSGRNSYTRLGRSAKSPTSLVGSHCSVPSAR